MKGFDRLVARLEHETKTTVGDWHIEQTLETISIVQSHLDASRESAEWR